MVDFSYPAHKLCRIGDGDSDLFLAATGTHIQTISLNRGQPLHVWPSEGEDNDGSGDEEQKDGDDRPTKRVKLENGSSLGREGSQGSEASIEFKLEGKERQKGERRRPKIPDISMPHVTHIITTSDGTHAVAVTGDDKSVRVFRLSKSGRLRQISSRPMPKKCCAITLSDDERSILTADKFGDVYALPLHPSQEYKPKPKPVVPESSFKPSATELTVHTKGNRDALRQQMNQKHKHVRREGPDFEHQLLLGHVSLLTDLAIATGEVDGKRRPFILTADRDEHIRVSRGIPQTHIIHSFCLGHTEFVSKLCVVPWQPSLLIAGNGEPSLRLFDWQQGRELLRFDFLKGSIRDDIQKTLASDRAVEKIAVSGIWPVAAQDDDDHLLLVAFESVPLMAMMRLVPDDSKWRLVDCGVTTLQGNCLDVAFFPGRGMVAVSVDTVHESGSYKTFRVKEASNAVQFFGIDRTRPSLSVVEDLDVSLDLIPAERLTSATKTAPESDGKNKSWEKIFTPLGELIYGLENLRKRRGRAFDEEDEEQEAEVGEMLEIDDNVAETEK